MAEGAEPRAVARMCLAAWTSGDLERTRSLLADEVSFAGPLGTTRGVDAYIDGIRKMAEIVERADERTAFAEGDDVCIIYDLVTRTPPASISTAGWYKVRDGKVVAVRAFFDPRPLVSGTERATR